MEIVILSENPKYQELIPGSKIAPSSIQSIIDIIETELFLNHHHHLCLCLLKGNLPYQFQIPIHIASQLLQRSQGAEIQLIVNEKKAIRLNEESDLTQIFSEIQFYVQNNQSNYKNQQLRIHSLYQNSNDDGSQIQDKSVVKYMFKCWSIQIELIYAEMSTSLSKYKHTARQFIESQDSSDRDIQQISKPITKIFANINQANYSLFVNWADIDNEQLINPNSELSKQYLTLRQQIDNEKNAFRNKIKIVKAIIGEEINVEKLLCQDDGKEENSEYKRIRQIFETIKNIDNVLIEQENQIKCLKEQIKTCKKKKSQKESEYAQRIAEETSSILELKRQIQNLKFKVKTVENKKEEYLVNRSFQLPNQQKYTFITPQIHKMKKIYRGMKKYLNFSTEYHSEQKNMKQSKINEKTENSYLLHRPHEKNLFSYKETDSSFLNWRNRNQIMLKRYASLSKKKQSLHKTTQIKQGSIHKKIEEYQNLRSLLILLYEYHATTSQISILANEKINMNEKGLQKKISKVIEFQKFPILSQFKNKLQDRIRSNAQQQNIYPSIQILSPSINCNNPGLFRKRNSSKLTGEQVSTKKIKVFTARKCGKKPSLVIDSFPQRL